MEEFKNRKKNKKKLFYRTIRFWIYLLIILIVILLFKKFFFGSANKKTQVTAIPVEVSQAKVETVPVYLSEIGTVTPIATVTVRTQINGQLVAVLFKEGQLVKKGDLLAKIDDRIYLAQLKQYQGQLERDMATLANAKVDLKRYQKLWKQDSVAKQTLDTQVATVKQDEGTVIADQGLIQGVEVNLIYTRIVSPVDGRVGLRLVDPGNFVQVSDTNGIAVITTIDPIDIIFSIPQENLPEVLQQVNAGKTMVVKAYGRQENKLLATGKLLTIDNQIDTTTGTVRLKARFPNPHFTLFPNQFINADLLLHTLSQAVTVPTSAVQIGPQGNFVYLVNADHTVTVKSVIIGPAYGSETVISSGVNAGQKVVSFGTDKLFEGAVISFTRRT